MESKLLPPKIEKHSAKGFWTKNRYIHKPETLIDDETIRLAKVISAGWTIIAALQNPAILHRAHLSKEIIERNKALPAYEQLKSRELKQRLLNLGDSTSRKASGLKEFES